MHKSKIGAPGRPGSATEKREFRGQTMMGLIGDAILDEPTQVNIPVPSRPKEETPKVVDSQYHIVKEIGRGGMGVVYEAIQRRRMGNEWVDGQFVALKEIMLEELVKGGRSKEEVFNLFISEIKVVSKLKHDNIVGIIDFGPGEEGRPYMAMELLEGRDLYYGYMLDKDYNPVAMPWREARDIIKQVCSALSYAHEYKEKGERKPIIHRDIKPENIFITTNSDGELRVKVLDFGLSKILQPDREKKKEAGAGTPEYMAPEQFQGVDIERGVDVDHRSDIYSVGVVFYELVSGTVPFRFTLDKKREDFNDSAEWMMYQVDKASEFSETVRTQMPPSLRQNGVDVPEELERIIMKCLEKEPENRYQSIRELRDDLTRLNGEQHIDTKNGSSPSIPDEPKVDLSRSMVMEAEAVKAALAKQGPVSSAVPPQSAPIQAPMPSGEAAYPTAMISVPYDSGQTEQGVVSPMDKTMITNPSRMPEYIRKKKLKYLGIIGAAVAATIGVGGVGIYLHSTRADDSVRTERRVQASASVDAGLREPLVDAQPVTPPPQQRPTEVTTHQVTIRTNVPGVEVIIDSTVLCTTSQQRTCNFMLNHGTDAVDVTLRKRGFVEQTVSVVPDSDRELPLVSMRARSGGSGSARPPNPPPSNTGRPVIRGE